jgi:hypothetical protein
MLLQAKKKKEKHPIKKPELCSPMEKFDLELLQFKSGKL